MRYLYFDEDTARVTILTYESTEHGVVLGSISEEAFTQISTSFLVQALMDRANFHPPHGVVIIVDDAPPS